MSLKIITFLLFSFLTLLISKPINKNNVATDDPTIVTTNFGKVQGKYVGNSISFTSIPYAKPPLNELRYANPVATPSWSNILETINDPPGCIQDCLMPWFFCPTKISEDCLYLNIFKPITNNSNDLLPVMIFIHGGSFLIGYSGGPIYNGTNLAILTNTIIVTINYRLGALGFLYLPDIGLYGNYGFQDQLFAIDWIYNNIKSFGGDNNKIIIYGESAGAASVGLHLMILNQTYIKGAIMESNPASSPLRDPITWANIPKLFQELCHCGGNLTEIQILNCLRNTPAETIAYTELIALIDSYQYINIDGMPWTPTINGKDGLFKDQPVFAYQKGNILDIPIIMGTNLNESTLFTYMIFPFPLKSDEYFIALSDVFGEQDTKKIFQFYNISSSSDQDDIRPIAARIGTDFSFRCPSHNMTASASIYNQINTVFFYHFIHISQWNDIIYADYPQCFDAVCHGNELPYVFDASGTLPLNGSWSTQELQLSELVQWYWATFAKSNNPDNANGYGDTWEPFNLNTQPTMLFDINKSKIAYNYDKEICDFWDSMGYTWIVS